MRLTVNGEARDSAGDLTVAGLVEALGLAGERVAVEVNRQLVLRSAWAETRLADGDIVEIVHFVGGGS